MNPFRHLLLAAGNRPPVGTWIMSASPIVAEAVACAGFDWAVIDMEHAPLDLMDVVHLLQAVAGTKTVPVLRLPSNDAVLVKRVLDAGAQTLLIPFVQDADEARRAVAATRYPPQGLRGMASMSRASRFGTVPNHYETANKQIGVIVQLESPTALQRLDEIVAVDGVDAIFVGPADLSGALGLPGKTTHPSVMDLMTQAAQRCRELGKPIGTIGSTPEAVAQYRAAGFSFVAISSDLGLLMRGAQAAVAALRTADSEHVHSLAGGTRLQGS